MAPSLTAATPVGGAGMATPIHPSQTPGISTFTNKPGQYVALSDEDLNAIMPKEGYQILEVPEKYKNIHGVAKLLPPSAFGAAAEGFMMQQSVNASILAETGSTKALLKVLARLQARRRWAQDRHPVARLHQRTGRRREDCETRRVHQITGEEQQHGESEAGQHGRPESPNLRRAWRWPISASFQASIPGLGQRPPLPRAVGRCAPLGKHVWDPGSTSISRDTPSHLIFRLVPALLGGCPLKSLFACARTVDVPSALQRTRIDEAII
ncbi:hypothetical protein K402DRAFT_268323 [Aulographum hederae CBS 113979]|uniref:Splicing factor 3B subunit 1 domain-containing protein n=1 Tax=Aulographum hederae CBS 113979 TaxID=1176131 RepID=A0A6G1H8B1_9PEZI|nr:hypothetical protein K402DRAFT_268323 [Aulographum hederae CBS 113979]